LLFSFLPKEKAFTHVLHLAWRSFFDEFLFARLLEASFQCCPATDDLLTCGLALGGDLTGLGWEFDEDSKHTTHSLDLYDNITRLPTAFRAGFVE
jgi:hypothetical protein